MGEWEELITYLYPFDAFSHWYEHYELFSTV